MSEFFISEKKLKLADIAKKTSANLIGDTESFVDSVSSLDEANQNHISFFNDSRYLDSFLNTKAKACFITEKYIDKAPKNLTLLVVKDPYLAFAKTSGEFFPLPKFSETLSQSTDIHPSAKIGKNCHISSFVSIGKDVIIGNNVYIGSNTVIYDNVKIGDHGYIYSNVSIKYSKIGNNFIIHDGVRIGQDGFGFAPNPAGHIKIPQIGGVIIGNDVEIGANTCIDRGAIKNTIISDGVKIDNMVQIAHNVVIGKHCFLASGAGIAGSTVIEDFVSIGGGVGIAPHIRIGSGSQIAPMSGVTGNVDSGSVLIGSPAINFKTFWRLQALFKRMLEKK